MDTTESAAGELLPRRRAGGPLYCEACWSGIHDLCYGLECPCPVCDGGKCPCRKCAGRSHDPA